METPKITAPLPERLFLAAAERCALPLARVAALVNILTEGFDSRWLARNQKFDLSFSETPRPSLRLSYNGFGEETAFRRRLASCAELLGGAPLKAAWGNILRTKPLDGELSYFGLDWAAGRAPRAKIQLWEITPERARAFGEAAGFSSVLAECPAVRAVGLTMQDDRAATLTTYHDAHLREARGWAARWGAAEDLARFVDELDRERHAFGLLSLDRDSSGRAVAGGWYKIYESPRGFTAAALAETERFWTVRGRSPGARESTLHDWKKQGLRIFTVAAALKFSEHESPRATLYYSAGPRSASE